MGRRLAFAALLVPLVAILPGCLSSEKRAELAAARDTLLSIAGELNQARQAGTTDLSPLLAKLAEADARLRTVEAEAKRERAGNALGIISQVLESGSPLLSIFLPGIGQLASAVGAGLGAAGNRLKRPTVVTTVVTGATHA